MKRLCTAFLAWMMMTTMFGGTVNVTNTSGWLETAMVQWSNVDGATRYVVEYSGEGIQGVSDDQLIRRYSDYWRADIPGLKAGTYSLTVKAYDENNTELAVSATKSVTVTAIKREGYAFTDGIIPGGYNLDGTPKSGARIIYLTANTANTVTCDVSTGNSTTTYTGIANILQAYGKGKDKTPLIIRMIGTIKDSDINGLKDNNYLNFEGSNNSDRSIENITLEGIGNDATLYGYGICFKRTRGLEIRNLGIMLFGDDAISMDTDNYHNFIHNCDFFYGKPGSDADQVKGDGSIDMKYRSTLTTISYNHFFDSGKVMGCGGATKEETNLLITFHHNWFDHCDSRCPRLNHTTAHIYNNYYDGVSVYGIGCTEVSNACIEGNYFRNVQRPMMIAGQGTDYIYASDPNKGTFSGQTGGMSKAYNNKVEGPVAVRLFYQTDNEQEFDAWLVENREEKVPETVSAKKGGHVYDNFDTAADMYSSVLDDPEQVATIVTTLSGRMEGGDLKWAFDNSVDDTNHDLNTGLKDAITSYTSGLQQIQGETTTPGEGGGEGEGGDTPTPSTVTGGGYVVDLQGDPNSGFTIVGDQSNSKGSVTIDGVAYNTCVKMGSSASVTFSISEPMELTLYFAASENKRIKITSTPETSIPEITIPADNIVKVTLPTAGVYTIKRSNGESYLYYIALSPLTSTAISNTELTANDNVTRWYTISGSLVSSPQKGGIYICVKGEKRSKIVFR